MNVEVTAAPAPADAQMAAPEIARVGVVGAGQMGNGIAHVCALAGLPVVLRRREARGARSRDDHRSRATWTARSIASAISAEDKDRGAGAHRAPRPITPRSASATS